MKITIRILLLSIAVLFIGIFIEWYLHEMMSADIRNDGGRWTREQLDQLHWISIASMLQLLIITSIYEPEKDKSIKLGKPKSKRLKRWKLFNTFDVRDIVIIVLVIISIAAILWAGIRAGSCIEAMNVYNKGGEWMCTFCDTLIDSGILDKG